MTATETLINGHKINTLIDSGASVSLIRGDQVSFLGINKIEELSSHKSAKTVSGEVINFSGKIWVTVQFGTKSVDHGLYISEKSPFPVILGNDFMRKFTKLTFNFKKGTVEIDDAESLLIGSQSTQIATLHHDIKIPPLTEVITKVRVPETQTATTILEPYGSFTEKFNVLPANCIVQPQEGLAPLRLFNPTKEAINLFANTKVATVSTLSEEVICVINSQFKNSPPAENITENFREQIHKNVQKSEFGEVIKQKLIKLLTTFHDIFSKHDFDLGRTDILEYEIDTGENAPVQSNPYGVAINRRPAYQEKLQKLIKYDLVEPSKSQYSSPVVIVPKPDKDFRMCIDYRKLNFITKSDRFSTPKISDVLDTMSGSTVFTSLDFSQSFYQVKLAEKDRHKSAFINYDRTLYQWKVCPMGMKNSGAVLCRLLSLVFQNIQWSFIACYVDDLVVFSKDINEHFEHLEEVFVRIRNAKLKLKLSKCHFAQKEIKLLGFFVSKNGIRCDPEKTKCVETIKTPKTQKHVRQFLGFVSYFRRFIKDFAKIAHPLTQLLKQSAIKSLNWTPECNTAFEVLKDALIKSPILALPDLHKQYILHVDACGVALGAFLSQKLETGGEVVIAYASRNLQPAELKFPIIEKEALALIWGINYFRSYLFGSKFLVYTDHKPLRYMATTKNPSMRLQRWAASLSEYDFEIVFIPGKENVVADALSRINEDELNHKAHSSPENPNTALLKFLPPEPTSEIKPIIEDKRVINILTSVNEALNTDVSPNMEEIKRLQKLDAFYGPLFQFLEEGKLPENVENCHKIQMIAPHYVMEEGVLYHLWVKEGRKTVLYKQLVIPETLEHEILFWNHSSPFSGHFSTERTFLRILPRFYFPQMYTKVDKFCKSCLACQKHQKRGKSICPPLVPIHASRPMEIVASDIIGPLPCDKWGFRHIITFTCLFTRLIECVAIKDQTQETAAKSFVNTICCRYSCPSVLLTDRGSCYTSAMFRTICKLMNTEKRYSLSYNPMCNGGAERINLPIEKYLTIYVNSRQDDWSEFLPTFQFSYNTSVHKTTKLSPFESIYGVQPSLPPDSSLVPPSGYFTDIDDYRINVQQSLAINWSIIRENQLSAKESQKNYYDRKVNMPTGLKVGALVLLVRHTLQLGLVKKLANSWTGPYKIIKLEDTNATIESIDNPQIVKKVNIKHLKICKGVHEIENFQIQPETTKQTGATIPQQTRDSRVQKRYDLRPQKPIVNMSWF